jgi:membrane protein
MSLISRDPATWWPFAWQSLRILGRALLRLWGRDVMLYVGGVSFFAMLAVFPAVAILIGLYSLLATPEQAAMQAEMIAGFMPARAEDLFEAELYRLIDTPLRIVSTQSLLALVVGAYASHRGFKAMLAGLSFIHDDEKPRGFVSFNLLALVVLLLAFALSAVVTAAFLAVRVMTQAMGLSPLTGAGFFLSEWTWSTVGLTAGLSLIYRYAMCSRPVIWTGAIVGGAAAAVLFAAMSVASAIYVEQINQLGATYGSVVAVVVLLIWLSWNVNAIFFGGALATEIEIAMDCRPERVRTGKPRPVSSQ